MTRGRQLDPITFEVIRSSFNAATEEMSLSLHRSAYSTNVKTRLDYSCAIFDRQCRLVAQAFSQPTHLGIMAQLVRLVVNEYGITNLYPDDGIAVNDPHRGASHLNDIFVISPVFYDDELWGFVANTAHHADVGGGAPASLGAFTETYQEGLCIPVVKLVQGGDVQPDLLKLILANVRAATEVGGDLRAQIGCNNLGVRRVIEILERHAPDETTIYIEELISYATRRTRSELAALPAGEYESDDFVDDDGITDEPIHLHVKVTIGDGRIGFDFAGTDPQRQGPMNATGAMTASACYFATKCLIDPDVPANHGFYSAIEVSAPEGSCLNAVRPAPCVGCWEMLIRVPDMIFKALAPAMFNRVAACSKSSVCNIGFGGLNPLTGVYYTFMETLAGGYGGRFDADGPDAVQAHIQNTQNAPIEEVESNYPVEILRYSLVNDSEGAGKFRGGLGVRRDYRFPGHEPSFTLLADRHKFAPWGLAGGLPATPARYTIRRGEQDIPIGSKTTFRVQPGDTVSIETAGGGGFGDPFERDPEMVLADVRLGKVSARRANECYGVIVNETADSVDDAATAIYRRAARPEQDVADERPP